jgi:hypothetical protein
VFAARLREEDARRASQVVATVLAHGLRCALTGGLAIAAHLQIHGRPVERKRLNDIDLVVETFDDVPESLASSFLMHHVHPDAVEGKILIQLIDETQAVRVDVFRAFGNQLSRASALGGDSGMLEVASVEDLVARTTSLVCGRLRRGRSVDAKHVAAFTQLRGLGRPEQLETAWADHRQDVPGTLEDAAGEATRLLSTRPELVINEHYSKDVVECGRCRHQGPFRPGPAEKIVRILGYW